MTLGCPEWNVVFLKPSENIRFIVIAGEVMNIIRVEIIAHSFERTSYLMHNIVTDCALAMRGICVM